MIVEKYWKLWVIELNFDAKGFTDVTPDQLYNYWKQWTS